MVKILDEQPDLSVFEKKINCQFKDRLLLKQVFVHRSYLNEHPKFPLGHNERLEFLGDAVLELIVTEYLYKNYPNPEGELTNWRSAIVRGEMLAKIAHPLNMSDLLLLSRGEQKSGGKAKELILANAFEALIGAIYLEFGYRKTQEFISQQLLTKLPEILEKRLFRDAKTELQELIQAKIGVTPIYQVISEQGPDHDKSFTVGVYVDQELFGQGTGTSKQKAETAAASQALEKIQAGKITLLH